MRRYLLQFASAISVLLIVTLTKVNEKNILPSIGQTTMGISGDGEFTFSTPGDHTVTIPDGCTAYVTYEIWGGGGAGGFINTTSNKRKRRAAPGGNGGGYSTGTMIVAAGNYTVTVGAGGVVTDCATAVANGGDSSAFGVTSGGGAGGPGANASTVSATGDVPGGLGGNRSGGEITAAVGDAGGGGGGSGPGSGNGADGVTGGAGGAGGAGGGGKGGDFGENGTNGTFPGGGGGGKGAGGVRFDVGDDCVAGVLKSGDGANGQVIITITILEASAGDDQTICEGDEAMLAGSASMGIAPYTYSWSDGVAVVASGASPTVTPSVTTTYTVTAIDDNGGTCTDEVTVTVHEITTPTFAQLGPYCVGTTAAALPTTSINSIAGTWNAAIGTASSDVGMTTYTFTPTSTDPTVCAEATTMVVEVHEITTPTFAQLGPYCVGTTAATLPTTSTNSIAGTWNAAIGTASSDVGMTTYTFTPTSTDPTVCAEATTMVVEVHEITTPTFAQLGPYCVGTTAATLPTTSTNSIAGTWNAAIGTASSDVGMTTYTFTPTSTDPTVCAEGTTMDVVVHAITTPTFTQLGPYCVGATAAALPTTSINSIAGTWNAAIGTASSDVGMTTYTFTPTSTDPTVCAEATTMVVEVHEITTPTFAQLGPYCVGTTAATLPTTSTNSIAGTWNAAIGTASSDVGMTTYTFTPTSTDPTVCAEATTMVVEVHEITTPTFAQLGPYCVGATADALPTTSTNGIAGTWDAAIATTTGEVGSTEYTFTPTSTDPTVCAEGTTMDVVVHAITTPTFTQLGPYCVGATADALPTTSTNGIAGTWDAAIATTTGEVGSTEYTFTPTSTDPTVCAEGTTMDVVVHAITTPTFTQLGPYCVGATADALPTTSTNGIAGTWDAAIATTTGEVGSTEYTFTPTSTDPTVCAEGTTMDVVVHAITTPTFTDLGPYCVGATPATLPTTSDNSIAGTWDAAISTTSAGTTTYTFTPTSTDPTVCAESTTMDVVVHAITTPTFTDLGPYCVGATPATLPTTSDNSIAGTWDAAISTTAAGTTTYTFTPTSTDPTVCAEGTTMDVVVHAITTPTFTDLGPYCVGATPATLPTTSDNSIAGTWDAAISTAAAGTTTYTFTPTSTDPTVCAEGTTMDVVVHAITTPTFTDLGPYCVGATPATLPTTSDNSIAGTWDAAISTAAAGTTTYTFTPTSTDPTVCAEGTTMDVVVHAITTPTFTDLGPYCVGATPATLPTTSTNSIAGTWDAAISTAAAGTTTYTFTPTSTDPTVCAEGTTMDVVVHAITTPTFTDLGPYCVGATPATLPTTSDNSIAGTWDAAISTAAAGTTTYTFTPTSTDPTVCAEGTTMDVVVHAITTPTFTDLGPYCVGATPATLPLTSTNSIAGTWDAAISTAAAGTTTYTFTPTSTDPTVCAEGTTMDVVVHAITTPTFTDLGPYCVGATPATLPTTSDNSIAGTWDAAISTTSAGTTTYTFTPTSTDPTVCAEGTTMDVVVHAITTPTFTDLGPYCVGATPATLPTTSDNSIAGTWDAAISTAAAGTTTYTFTPTSTDPTVCAEGTTMDVVVHAITTPTFTDLGPYCVGATPATLPLTSTNSIAGTWDAAISTAAAGTTTYTFTPTSTDPTVCAEGTTMDVVVHAITTPTFTDLGPYCVGATPATLPTTSDNSIAGTWDAAISTTSAGTTTYTFTPTSTDPTVCAEGTTMDVVVHAITTPTFTDLGPYCVGATPATLPTTSDNSIAGTWDAAISTTSAGTTTYTFTPTSPDPTVCAEGTTMDVVVHAITTPTFTDLGPYCVGATPATLPTTSDNSIAGTWDAAISTAAAGTTTYTFTPTSTDPTVCAEGTTMDVVVHAITTPTFTDLGPYCVGATPATLPTTSDNSIAGTWDAVISTAAAGTTTYTFTPTSTDPTVCAEGTTMDVVVHAITTPTFTDLGPYCVGATPATLPTTSDNSIAGTWDAAISTTSAGTTTYTFTPTSTDPTVCAEGTTMDVVVHAITTPTFTDLGPYCVGATPATLPTTSDNSIAGTWDAAISTAAAGTTTYTFTPTSTDPTVCAEGTTMDVVVHAITTPTFTDLGPYCVGATPATLPLTSTNGIAGTWDAAISTTSAGTTTYTFTPTSTDPTVCAEGTTMDVVVHAITTPTFTDLGPYCVGATPATLPTTSDNSIAGTWDAAISTTSAGTTTYTFTPTSTDPTVCAEGTTMDVVVHAITTPTFTDLGPYCVGATPATLPTTSDNSIAGTWDAAISTAAAGTTTYTFTPTSTDPTVCAEGTTMDVVVHAITTPTFTDLGPYCVGATPATLPTTSDNSIAGTWDAAISTTSAGTTTYTFTPTSTDPTVCAEGTTMDVVVHAITTPTFTDLGPYCVGATPATLPTTSDNSIAGTWDAAISTTSAGTTTYTFTPTSTDPTVCAEGTTMDVVVHAITTPTFTDLGPYCVGATPATLPTTSDNSIAGTWDAAISTAAAGTTTYTFTPTSTDPTVCAEGTTMDVVVHAITTPTFTDLGPYCVGATPATLPTTSDNSIAGTWDAAISTTSAGTTTYTFTPTSTDPTVCAEGTTMDVVVHAITTPTFTDLGPYCVGTTPATLPTTSDNSIAGTWDAAISTTSAGTTTYTFTPTSTDPTVCAEGTTMDVVVHAITTPTFTDLGPYCVGTTPATLPTTSDNSIAGTWDAAISTTSAGTTIYTFTPTSTDPTVCAEGTTMDVVVHAITTPTFTDLGPYCVGATPATLPTTSDNSIAGTWDAAISTTSAGTTTYTFTPTSTDPTVCAEGTTMDVVVHAITTPTFTDLGPYCVGATPATLPTTSDNSIAGTWDAAISTTSAGTTTYTFTPTSTDPTVCAEGTTMDVVVHAITTPTFTDLGPYCVGATPTTLPTTSDNSIAGTWDAAISTAAAGTTTYTFTPTSTDPTVCAEGTTMDVVVHAITTPTFTDLGPYCVGATPATLPTTSTNSIAGTWDAVISTATAGTTTYTFTPTSTDPTVCAEGTTMDVVVHAITTPTFTDLGPYCVGATPATLPTTSDNSIAGTWDAAISTAAAGTTTYTFTPTSTDPTVCAEGTTMDVVVHAITTPTFTDLGPYCEGATAATLPTTSTNSIAGTWNAAIGTASSDVGMTTYTFTPTSTDPTVCAAATTTMDVVVHAITTPTFTDLGPYCVGATAADLPTTSTNGIAGTWDAAIGTTSAGTTTYTFTPTSTDPTVCAEGTTMDVVVHAITTPTFTDLGPYCVDATPATLPLTSTNGIAGTWDAAISTAAAGTTTYTFTPTSTDPTVCAAATTTMDVVVHDITTPTFTDLGPYCVGATPATLPLTSDNSIPGTWDAAISTTAAGTTTYTFTPTSTDPTVCAEGTTMDVVVHVITTPTFTDLGPYCVDATPATLPLTSTNGIAGTWDAAISTATAGTTTYTFTPTSTDPTVCAAATTTMDVVVHDITTPTFTDLGPYCVGATPADLPLISDNNITGTWDAVISTTSAGMTTYTFTPTSTDPTVCAEATTMDVIINALPSAPTIIRNDATCTYSYQATNAGDTFNPTTIPNSGPATYPASFNVIVTNTNGCSATFTVDPEPCPSAGAFVATNTGTSGTGMFMAEDPCKCNGDQLLNADGSIATAGTFSETVKVTGPANFLVRIKTATGIDASLPAALAETPVGSGNYEVTFNHGDRVGYKIDEFEFSTDGGTTYNVITAADGLTPITISNVCAYPQIACATTLPASMLITDAPITLGVNLVSVGSPTFTALPGYPIITVNDVAVTTFDPAASPVVIGNNAIVATYDFVSGSGANGDILNPAVPIDGDMDASNGVCPVRIVAKNIMVISKPVPTMSQWGLLIFGLLILNLGVFLIYRKEQFFEK